MGATLVDLDGGITDDLRGLYGRTADTDREDNSEEDDSEEEGDLEDDELIADELEDAQDLASSLVKSENAKMSRIDELTQALNHAHQAAR